MKKLLLLAVYGISMSSAVNAQDSTNTSSRTGVRIAAEFSLLENSSLKTIQQQLQQTGLDASGVGNLTSGVIFSFVRENEKSIYETRLQLVNSNNVQLGTSQIDKRVTFYGYGIGSSRTFNLVNNRRFLIGPTIGTDFMWYRLRILPQNSQNLSLPNIVANPAFYNTIRLRQGFYFNLLGAVSADYKTGWFKKYYDDFRIGARVGYQLPIIRSTKWRYGDGSVNELSAFKSNALFAQIGFTLIMKKRGPRRN